MKIHKRDLFEELEPPPGGLVDLRLRLAEQRRRPAVARTLWPATAAAATAVAVLLLWLRISAPSDRVRVSRSQPELARLISHHPAAVELGLHAGPIAPVAAMPGTPHAFAASRVPVAGDEVIFYWIPPEAPTLERPAVLGF